MFTFEFADGVSGTVNAETAEFTEIISEEELIQSNADILSEIYANDVIQSDMFTDSESKVLLDSAAVSVNKTDEIADQTDLQVMILTENMSAFANEDNISNGIDVLDPIYNTSAMNQILISEQVK